MVQRTDRPPGLRTPGYLTFCTDIGYPPMEFYDQGVPAGADIEIARELAWRLGCEANFVDQPVADIIDALCERRCDLIINAFTDNPARRQRMAFVHYLSVGQAVLARRQDHSQIESVEDLAGGRIAVQGDTSNEDTLRVLDQANQRSGLAPLWTAAFRGATGTSTASALASLLSGDVDAHFVDSVSAQWLADRHPELEIAALDINREPYGIGCRKSDVAVKRAVQRAVIDLYLDGTMRRILGRWHLESVALSSPSLVAISG